MLGDGVVVELTEVGGEQLGACGAEEAGGEELGDPAEQGVLADPDAGGVVGKALGDLAGVVERGLAGVVGVLLAGLAD